jgi:hypothetical protein
MFKVDWATYFEKHMIKINAQQKYFDINRFSQKELQLRIAEFVNGLSRERSLLGKNKINALALSLERVRLSTL